MTKRLTKASATSAPQAEKNTVDLEHYVPAYMTWVTNKLSRGASQHYLKTFSVGIETWRCLVLLAIEGSVSAQQVSKVIGMDKGSVSRCFKGMQESGLIRNELDDSDGRVRIAVLTPKGRLLHNQIIGMALERERAFLSVLNAEEVDVLMGFLHRLHENLPEVEAATLAYARKHFPRGASIKKDDDGDET